MCLTYPNLDVLLCFHFRLCQLSFVIADPLTIEERCILNGGVGIIPHPTQCQQYYNCSLVYENIPRLFEQHLMECTYPQLFNEDTKQCDHYEHVKCLKRNEPVDGCKTINNLIYFRLFSFRVKFLCYLGAIFHHQYEAPGNMTLNVTKSMNT